ECLHDGGDSRTPAGLDAEGRIHGLDPSDAIAEYRDSQGGKRLSCSNRVCVCGPRFAVLNSETKLEANEVALVLSGAETSRGQALLAAKVPPSETLQKEKMAGFKSRRSLNAAVGAQVLGKLNHLMALNAAIINEGPFVVIGATKLYELDSEVRTKI